MAPRNRESTGQRAAYAASAEQQVHLQFTHQEAEHTADGNQFPRDLLERRTQQPLIFVVGEPAGLLDHHGRTGRKIICSVSQSVTRPVNPPNSGISHEEWVKAQVIIWTTPSRVPNYRPERTMKRSS